MQHKGVLIGPDAAQIDEERVALHASDDGRPLIAQTLGKFGYSHTCGCDRNAGRWHARKRQRSTTRCGFGLANLDGCLVFKLATIARARSVSSCSGVCSIAKNGI